MGFIVRKPDFRPWPVTVRLHVSDDAGSVTLVEQTFVGHFMPFTEGEHAAISEEIDAAWPKPEDGKAIPRERILERNSAYFARLMTGWDGVHDDQGAALPFSAGALDALVTGPDGFAISEALFVAIAELRNGVAPIKNLLPSAAPGESSSAAGGVTTAIATI